jgi:hypothetical protein
MTTELLRIILILTLNVFCVKRVTIRCCNVALFCVFRLVLGMAR